MSTFKSTKMETIYVEDSVCWGLSEDLQALMNEFLPGVGDNWDCELELGSLKGLCDNIAEGNALPTANLKETNTSEVEPQWDELLGYNTNADNEDDLEGLFDDVESLLLKRCETVQPPQNTNSHKINSFTTSTPSIAILPEPAEFSNSMTPPYSPQSCSTDSGVDVNVEDIAYQIDAVEEPYTPPLTPNQNAPETDASTSATDNSSNPSSPAHNSKPYGRRKRHSKTVEPKIVICSNNKKLRKRDQNRDAATRYRLKKRAEVDGMSKQEVELESKNRELKDRVDSLSSEIKYLRGLLKEVVIARMKS